MLKRSFFVLSAYLLFNLPIFSTSVTEQVTGGWFSDPIFADPIRFHHLNGATIAYLRDIDNPHPLIFSQHLDFFRLLDASVANRNLRLFKSKQFAKNKKNYAKNPAKISSSSHILDFDISAREDRLFDSVHLLKHKSHVPTPTDEQLQAFLQKSKPKSVDFTEDKIIQTLLKDEYADNPVSSILHESPIVQKVLNSEKFRLDKPSLFRSVQNNLESSTSSFEGQNSKDSNSAESPSLTTLRLKASKPTNDGSIQPAQASEIYLTTRDLRELLKELNVGPAIAGEVRSVAELWAKAEKNVSHNPEIALGVKSILLSAKVGRARTDPYGQASLENLSPDDKYYVIGIDKDIETDVVTIWSKEVEVEPGENLVELSSTDIIYQE